MKRFFLAAVILLPYIVIAQNKSYQELIQQFQARKLSYRLYLTLLDSAVSHHNEGLLDSVCKSYSQDYLSKLSVDQLLSKENLNFFVWHDRGTQTALFHAVIANVDKAGELYGDTSMIRHVISVRIGKAEIQKKYCPGNDSTKIVPNWKQIGKSISNKYGRYWARYVLIDAQFDWAVAHHDSLSCGIYRVKQLRRDGLPQLGMLESGFLNNDLYFFVFMFDRDVSDLKDAAKWAKQIIDNNPTFPEYYDTYASLLYKLNRKNEALMVERKAMELDRGQHADIQDNYEKMKAGQKTWKE